MGNSSRANESCLTGPCRYSGWGPFLSAAQPQPKPGNFTVREYSAEVPILQRLLRSCPHRTTDPAAADMFVVPYYFGLAATLGWKVSDRYFGSGARAMHKNMTLYAKKHLWRELRHLNPQTASRHVFFFTADLEWCCPFSHRVGLSLLGTDASDKWADNTTGRVILVNLGDDQIVNVRPMRPRVLSLSKAIKHNQTFWPVRVTNGLVVPFRVSQWVDDRAWRTWRPEAQRRYRLFSNVDVKRSTMRGEVLRMINRSAHKAGASSSLYLATMLWGQRMAPPAEAQRLALESDFCFCPTGDAKGFTARFYFSLLLGCLPVRVDGWEPHWEPGRLHSGQLKMNTTWPFQHLVDWRRLVVEVPWHGRSLRSRYALLRTLLSMPRAEVLARRRYLRSVVHWLGYRELADGEAGGDGMARDAADAAVAELVARVQVERSARTQRAMTCGASVESITCQKE
jgi:hypothetical protein